MNSLFAITIVLALLQKAKAKAQGSDKYLPDKPGKWKSTSYIKRPEAEVVDFNKNLAVLDEWYHQNKPMLRNPKGYDLISGYL